MKYRIKYLLLFLPAMVFLGTAATMVAVYKARTWNVSARESYPASLMSEGVMIGVKPLFNDALAAQVFDKDDIVTRGIMPLEIVIFNDNDHAIEVDGMSIQLIRDEEHIRTLTPSDAVSRLYGGSKSLLGQPKSSLPNEKAREDFDNKFLLHKPIAPHSKGGGFVYMPVYDGGNLASYLSTATVYIPNVYRQDDGSRLVFFEISLNAALPAAGSRHGSSH
jgi:hypothetical protein